jgi:succinate dehydrogenase (ubiquinone) flavoprotein subunit
MMRAFAKAIHRQQCSARISVLKRTYRQRGFATVNTQSVKGMTVIDHHYEYPFLLSIHWVTKLKHTAPL